MGEHNPEPIHGWFGLTYSNYLVIPRTLLQSMPVEWQERFVACLREAQTAFDHIDHAYNYTVQARGENGRFIQDPVPHYDRGRAYVEPRTDRAREGEKDECSS